VHISWLDKFKFYKGSMSKSKKISFFLFLLFNKFVETYSKLPQSFFLTFDRTLTTVWHILSQIKVLKQCFSTLESWRATKRQSRNNVTKYVRDLD